MAKEKPDAEPQTSELLAQIQAGHTDAVEALFRRYYDRVLRIVRRQLGPGLREKIESGDVVQETFATAHLKLNGFELRQGSSLINWFARISERRVHAAAEYFGAAKRDRACEQSLDAVRTEASSDEHAIQFAADTIAPSDLCGKAEQVTGLWEALMLLSEDQREIIMLRNFGDYSWQTIAAVMRLSTANAARARHARAMASLSAHMLRRDGGEANG